MKTLLMSCLAGALLAGAAAAQAPATPPPAGARPPAPAAPAALGRPKAPANQILEYGSFELPRVQARSPKLKGGNFLLFTSDEWMDFHGEPDSSHGSLTIGLTNEVARTGRQSMYIEFSKLNKPRAEARLVSQPIPVKPSQPYRVGIWGRMDKKQALTLDQPLPALRLQVDFFQADGETQTGDQVLRAQPMPGSRDRAPFFVSKEWHEYYAEFQTPEDAACLRITWSWTAPMEPGEINGVMFFDDATLIGEKVQAPEDSPDPAQVPAPAADGSPATPAPATPQPAEPVIAFPTPPAPNTAATPKPASAGTPKPRARTK